MPQGKHPDEVALDASVSSEHFKRRNSLPNNGRRPIRTASPNDVQRVRSALVRNPSTGPTIGPRTAANAEANLMIHPTSLSEDRNNPVQFTKPQQPAEPPQGQQLPRPRPPQNAYPPNNPHSNDSPSLDSSNTSDHEPPVGFFTAKAAETLQSGPASAIKAPAFNPHLESPSIRKTAGVDHKKTKPIGRDLVGAPLLPVVSPRPNFTNPQSDKMRKVGMPMGAASPLQNRGSYKPPQMKRSAEINMVRSALGDVTNASVNVSADVGGDVKRQRIGMEAQGLSNNQGMLNI